MEILGYKKDYQLFNGVDLNKKTKFITPQKNNQSKAKVKQNLNDLFSEIELKDGMTLSFHHHLRRLCFKLRNARNCQKKG